LTNSKKSFRKFFKNIFANVQVFASVLRLYQWRGQTKLKVDLSRVPVRSIESFRSLKKSCGPQSSAIEKGSRKFGAAASKAKGIFRCTFFNSAIYSSR
jgi:hypothetical protein